MKENIDDIIGMTFPQKCGDSFVVLEKTNKSEGQGIFYKCQFIKYPYIFFETKSRILSITFDNPLIEQKEFIEKEWPINDGEFIIIIKKSKEKDKGGHYLFECNYKKYPLKKNFLCNKKNIIKGAIYSKRAEREFLIRKIWLQKCGDWIKILGKDKKGQLVCEFQKYPCIRKATKKDVIEGNVKNYELEKHKKQLLKKFESWKNKKESSFINKEFKQYCGDFLKVKKKLKNNYYECEFIKYPYKILAYINNVLRGTVNNPKIEQVEFIDKLWPQNCGDTLRIIRKSQRKINNGEYLWEAEFIKYPYKIEVQKGHIIRGVVDNPNLPWRTKEGLLDAIYTFKEKPTLKQISQYLSINISTIGQSINKFELRNYIQYFPNHQEEEIISFLNTFYKKDIIQNTFKIIKDREIDIYFPLEKFGIEYNGNYWHSDLFKEKNYHQEKSLLAQEKNIKLIHIWEWEWLNKEQIIKSLIKSKLGIFDKRVGASKCKIKELDYKTYASFCNENHLQGEAGAKVKLGLFYKDELVQIMSFSLPRFTSDYEWEIIRECSKLNYIIIGGKEKLWSYFVKNYNPNNCISYCDFSKFNGSSYLKLGFKQEKLNKPGFVWWDSKSNEVFWRNPYKNQEMKEKGYYKIWDCGQLVFTWIKKY